MLGGIQDKAKALRIQNITRNDHIGGQYRIRYIGLGRIDGEIEAYQVIIDPDNLKGFLLGWIGTPVLPVIAGDVTPKGISKPAQGH